MRTNRGFASILLLLLLPAAPAPAEAPDAVVRETLANARRVVLTDATRSEKLTELHDVARGLLDTRSMGDLVMGPTLAAQSAADQAEFHTLFDEFIVRAYLRRLILFKKPRFAFKAARADGDRARVETQIITPNDAFHVDYEMRLREGGWLATDIVVEGISLRSNYREQFASILRDRSFEELLALMRRKLGVMAEGDES